MGINEMLINIRV